MHELTDEQRRRASARAGAEIAELDGLGHWWFTQDPQRGAATINDFWAGVGSVFDSSYERGAPVDFPLGGVVPGLQQRVCRQALVGNYATR
jgi:hypothetical protein